MKYAILMADILNSRKMDSKIIMSQFKRIVSELNDVHKKIILSPVTITLGDEFQGVLASIEDGIKFIYATEELILKKRYDIKLRYVLYYGEIETKLNRVNSYEMLGTGLTDARNKLSALKKEENRFMIFTNRDDQANSVLNKGFSIYQGIVDGWKPKDLRVVSEFLTLEDYKKVAQRIKTDISSAWRRKKSLRINEYNGIKEIIIYLAGK